MPAAGKVSVIIFVYFTGRGSFLVMLMSQSAIEVKKEPFPFLDKCRVTLDNQVCIKITSYLVKVENEFLNGDSKVHGINLTFFLYMLYPVSNTFLFSSCQNDDYKMYLHFSYRSLFFLLTMRKLKWSFSCCLSLRKELRVGGRKEGAHCIIDNKCTNECTHIVS